MRRLLGVMLIAVGFARPGLSVAESPGWWVHRGVVRQDAPVATNDLAAVNSGQLKWMATVAREEFDAMLADGASPQIAAAIDALSNDGNHAVVNIGQVKSLAALFYDQLISHRFVSSYLWTVTEDDDNDFAPVNIGQVKAVFAFDLDVDDDRMPDWWEQQFVDGVQFHGIEDVQPGHDPDGDGRDNATEHRQGTNPLQSETASTNGIPSLVVITPMREGGRP